MPGDGLRQREVIGRIQASRTGFADPDAVTVGLHLAAVSPAGYSIAAPTVTGRLPSLPSGNSTASLDLTVPMADVPDPPFERVISEAVALQEQLPWLEMVAVGGTAAALHAGHRYSTDVDHVTALLREQFDVVNERLDQWEGWRTNRVNRPVVILGERHGVELGVRQLRRSVPLEVCQVHDLWVPTPAEALRIKAFLCTERQATRDFLDVAALTELIGMEHAKRSLSFLNQLYTGVGNQTRLTRFAEVARQRPVDQQRVDLASYKGIKPPYDRWEHVADVCRQIANEMFLMEMDRGLPTTLDGYADPTKLRGGRTSR